MRAVLAAVVFLSVLFAGLAWRLAAGGRFTLTGVAAWVLCVLLLRSALVTGSPPEPRAVPCRSPESQRRQASEQNRPRRG
jgi:hypothetical protein